MGCDIHCYIEYKTEGNNGWSGFGGRVNPGRNYAMFGAMAGVRTEHIPFISPRGYPDDGGYDSLDDWGIFVSDSQKEPTSHEGGEYYYSKAHAEEYVAKGYCQWIERDGRKTRVTNCDWHTPSWLTPDEFELAIAAYLKSAGFNIGTLRMEGPQSVSAIAPQPDFDAQEAKWALNGITEYWAILSTLRCFEAQGHTARIIFWFDN